MPKFIFALLLLLTPSMLTAATQSHVALVDMNLMILPGTQGYLENAIAQAKESGAKLIIVKLNTPGGMLQTSQEMIQKIFESPIPIVIYVSPTGATAASAGVFITMAGHVAVMSPGTSIGAAHPVSSDGKDIEGDMRKKAENMTIAMVRSISERRGRNIDWAEESVKNSSSITANEAVQKKVVDFIASDLIDLLKQLKGKKIILNDQEFILGDYSELPIVSYEMSLKNKVVNVMSNPSVAALLWLGATTGLSIELYSPGAILPGVVGVICLVLAMAVMQIIPITQTGMILLGVGALMLASEMFIPSGVLAIGGIFAIVIGAIYLVDPSTAPGLSVNLNLLIPFAICLSGLMLWVLRELLKAKNQAITTGTPGLIGERVQIDLNYLKRQTIFVNGEIWNAELQNDSPAVLENDTVEVVEVKDGLVLVIKKV